MTLREEMLVEILDTLNISLTAQEVATIAKDFADGLEMEREINHTPFMFSKPECEECKRLKSQVKDFEAKEQRLRKYYSYDGRGNIDVDKTNFLKEYFGVDR